MTNTETMGLYCNIGVISSIISALNIGIAVSLDDSEQKETGLPVRQFTYFDGENVRWNTAANICNSTGGHLVKIDSPETLQALAIFVEGDWQSIENRFWIGLFWNSPDGLMWDDCTRPLYSLTDNKFGEKRYCYSVDNDLVKGQEWESRDCRDWAYVVCETVSSETCSTFVDYGRWTPQFSATVNKTVTTSTVPSNVSKSVCEDICLSDSSLGRCYGYSYGSDLLCHLHYAETAGSLWFSTNFTRPLPLYILFCFIARDELYTLKDTSIKTAIPLPPCLRGADSSTNVNLMTINRSSLIPEEPTSTSAWSSSVPATTIRPTGGSSEGRMATILIMRNTTNPGPQTIEMCRCKCRNISSLLSKKEKTTAMQKIITKLTINTRNLSSSVRKHTSAVDDRPSSQSIGYIGIIMLSVVFGGICILDLPVMIIAAKSLIDTIFKRQYGVENSP